MPNVYIFTCGTSLVTNFHRNDNQPGKESPSTELRTVLTKYAIQDLISGVEWSGALQGFFPKETPQSNTGAQAALLYWSKKNVGDPELTAEISSVVKIQPDPNDQIVLLASNTPEGLFSALMNAHLMSQAGNTVECQVLDWENDLEPAVKIQWDSDHLCLGPVGLPRVKDSIKVYVVAGLDPRQYDVFEKHGVGNLVRTLTYIVDRANASVPRFKPQIVFTGGFKASLPILTQAAIWLGGVPMIGLYENARDKVTIPVFGLPPSKMMKRAAIGFMASRSGTPYREFAPFDYSQIQEYVDLPDPSLVPLFQKSSDGKGMQLTLLGKALQAIVISRLSSEYAAIEKKELLKND